MVKPLYPQFNMDVQTFYPKCKVVAYSDWGSVDLTDDVRLINTHKSLAEIPGIWSVQLVERPRRNGLPPYAYLRPMDYIEIELWNAPSKDHYYMRGFIENIQRVFSAAGNQVTRYTQINGHDMGGLLLRNEVRYLWQIDPAAVVGNQFALETNYGIGMEIIKPADFMQDFMRKILDGFVMDWQKTRIPNVPAFGLKMAVPEEYAVNRFIVPNSSGSLANTLQYYLSPPFLEVFYIDEKTGPTFYLRQPPLTDYDGNELGVFDLTPDSVKLQPVEVPMSYLRDWALGRSVNEMYSFFFVMSDTTSTNQQAGFNYMAYVGGEAVRTDIFEMARRGNTNLPSVGTTSPSNPTYDKDIEMAYGYRALEINTPLLSGLADSVVSWGDVASKMTNWLYRANKDNWRFESGTLTVHGDGRFQIGQYVTIKDFGTFYVEGVDHQFTTYNNGPGNAWVTTLGVTRGRRVK